MANDKESSVFRMITIGIVSENKQLSSSLIEVLPLEKLNLKEGELTSKAEALTIHGLDESGQLYDATVNVGSTIEAEWWGHTNRITPPDLRRGEQVLIYQSGDADKYYWSSPGRDDDLRRLETVIYRWSGFPDNTDEPINYDNSYTVEVSSHKKLITLHTSQRNGEYTQYTLQFNPGDGQVTLQDTHGNVIQLDTLRTNILLKNADGTIVELNKTNINLISSNTINAKTKDYNINCVNYNCQCVNYTVNASNSISLTAGSGGGGGGVSFQSGGLLNMQSADDMTISSAKTLTLSGMTNSITL